MDEAEIADIVAARRVGIGDEHLRAAIDELHRLMQRLDAFRELIPHHLDFGDADANQRRQHGGKTVTHHAAGKAHVETGDQHEDEPDRQPLVGHVGREHHARRREINRAAEHEHRVVAEGVGGRPRIRRQEPVVDSSTGPLDRLGKDPGPGVLLVDNGEHSHFTIFPLARLTIM